MVEEFVPGVLQLVGAAVLGWVALEVLRRAIDWGKVVE